jgi:hypothetical protein
MWLVEVPHHLPGLGDDVRLPLLRLATAPITRRCRLAGEHEVVLFADGSGPPDHLRLPASVLIVRRIDARRRRGIQSAGQGQIAPALRRGCS